MMALVRTDPIARIVLLLWAGTAAVYFVPGVPHEFLERLGDRYSTLPVWPWAVAACLYGLAAVPDRSARRFWYLQALSFGALLAIEVPWAFSQASNSAWWDAAAECCFFAYYACQLASVSRTRVGALGAVSVSLAAAAVLSILALQQRPFYADSWPSYLTYLAFDAAMTAAFWRGRRGVSPAWAAVYTGLALTSALVFATDVLDMLSYTGALAMESGMATDILWTLPPVAYALVARFGRQRLEPTP